MINIDFCWGKPPESLELNATVPGFVNAQHMVTQHIPVLRWYGIVINMHFIGILINGKPSHTWNS